MEHIPISLNDVAQFDQLVHEPESLRETGDLKIVTKDAGTVGGNPVAVLAFTVLEKDNKPVGVAQAVTTVRVLQGALAVLKGRYPKNAF